MPRNNPRNKPLTIRLSEEERKAIEESAANDDRTASDWVRVLVLRELKCSGKLKESLISLSQNNKT